MMFAIIQLLKAHRTDRKKDSCWRLNFHVGFFRNGIFYRVDTVKYMKHKLEIKFKVCALEEILLPNFANLHQNRANICSDRMESAELRAVGDEKRRCLLREIGI